MGMIKSPFKRMSTEEWYYKTLKDCSELFDKKFNAHKSIDSVELNGMIEQLQKANSEAIKEFEGREITKSISELIIRFLQGFKEHQNSLSLSQLIQRELTLFSQKNELINLYKKLLQLKISVEYFSTQSQINKSVDFKKFISLLEEVIIAITQYKKKFSTIDFSSLIAKIKQVTELGLEDVNDEQKIKLIKELDEISKQALSVLCENHDIKN